MTGRKIVVTLARDGSVSAKTEGIYGSKCLDVIPLLEELLDGEAIDSALTRDYARESAEARDSSSVESAAVTPQFQKDEQT